MSTNGSPRKTINMAPTGGLLGSQQQRSDDIVGASNNNAWNTPSKDTQFGQPTNQIHPQPGYNYLHSPPLFPGAHLLYHYAGFNMTPSSQPSTGATQEYRSYGPSWQAYDFPQRCYGGPQMFPHQQVTGNGPLSPGAARVPLAPPRYNSVIWPTSSSCTAPEQLPGAPGRHSSSLPLKRFQPAVEQWRTDVTGIANLPPLPEIFYDIYNADYESDNSSDFVGV